MITNLAFGGRSTVFGDAKMKAASLFDGQVFEGAGLGDVLLALLDRGRVGLAQLKGPVLAPDGFSSPPNGGLVESGCSAVFGLSLDDGIDGASMGPQYLAQFTIFAVNPTEGHAIYSK